MIRHRIESYKCPRLNGTAQITIRDYYIKADEMPSPILDESTFTDCSPKMYCGIMERAATVFARAGTCAQPIQNLIRVLCPRVIIGSESQPETRRAGKKGFINQAPVDPYM